MFAERDLPDGLEAVREAHAPAALVLDCERDFETLPSDIAEELGLVVDAWDPISVPAAWLPSDAPEILRRYAGDDLTVGAPGDGGVAWTRRTEPPVVLVKPRIEGAPDPFVDFLIAEALVQVGLGRPEHFLGFFRDRYPDLATAARDRLDPTGTYQLAAALYEAYLGRHTREVFAGWKGEQPALFDAWLDAGERLEPRVSDLPEAMAAGRTEFGNAAELACSAIKHTVGASSDEPSIADAPEDVVELPSPFAALDTEAYREHGADYAVRWTEKTLGRLD